MKLQQTSFPYQGGKSGRRRQQNAKSASVSIAISDGFGIRDVFACDLSLRSPSSWIQGIQSCHERAIHSANPKND